MPHLLSSAPIHAVFTTTEAAQPPVWAVLPFVILLAAIAVAPLVIQHWWHRWYPAISLGFTAVMITVYGGAMGHGDALIHTAFEYVSFLALLGSLFLATGGVVVDVRLKATPGRNILLLLAGAALANVVGTTGAALLLIRPWLRMNAGRLRPYHVVFFIIMVANVGGALTPIGDPPLFLGYLRGIDFFRFFSLNLLPWLLALGGLSALFWWFDVRNRATGPEVPRTKVGIEGARGLWFLVAIVGAVLLDPAKLPWLPAIEVNLHGEAVRVSFVRELIQVVAGLVAWRTASPHLHRINAFSFAPIKEVAFLFLAIFATMIPALELIRAQASAGSLAGIPFDSTFFYFGTGILSSVLDNAPTFMAFLAGMEGKYAMTTAALATSSDPAVIRSLTACAVAAVFWGAMTYIGNGPNFMVKSICEEARDSDGKPLVQVPGFFAYIFRFTLPILLPVLVLVWLMFLH